MNDKLKPVPPVKLQPQITWPHVNISVALDGIKIDVFFGPTTCFSQVLDAPATEALYQQLVKIRRKAKEQEQLIGDVMRSKQRD